MYFGTKNTLKNNHNQTPKQTIVSKECVTGEKKIFRFCFLSFSISENCIAFVKP
jgi:hypothetical protein